jgi:ferredoxin
MKVTIDRPACVSCGSCWNVCPAFFEEDPGNSSSRVVEQYRLNGNPAEGTPTDDLEPCARDAADLCPVSVIGISD